MPCDLPSARAFQPPPLACSFAFRPMWELTGHGHHLPENAEVRTAAVQLHQERAVVLGAEDRSLVVELQDPRPPRRPARPHLLEAGQVRRLIPPLVSRAPAFAGRPRCPPADEGRPPGPARWHRTWSFDDSRTRTALTGPGRYSALSAGSQRCQATASRQPFSSVAQRIRTSAASSGLTCCARKCACGPPSR